MNTRFTLNPSFDKNETIRRAITAAASAADALREAIAESEPAPAFEQQSGRADRAGRSPIEDLHFIAASGGRFHVEQPKTELPEAKFVRQRGEVIRFTSETMAADCREAELALLNGSVVFADVTKLSAEEVEHLAVVLENFADDEHLDFSLTIARGHMKIAVSQPTPHEFQSSNRSPDDGLDDSDEANAFRAWVAENRSPTALDASEPEADAVAYAQWIEDEEARQKQHAADHAAADAPNDEPDIDQFHDFLRTAQEVEDAVSQYHGERDDAAFAVEQEISERISNLSAIISGTHKAVMSLVAARNDNGKSTKEVFERLVTTGLEDASAEVKALLALGDAAIPRTSADIGWVGPANFVPIDYGYQVGLTVEQYVALSPEEKLAGFEALQAQMFALKNFESSSDGAHWARAFLGLLKRQESSGDPITIDQDFLRGWFANAIETGITVGRSRELRAAAEKEAHRAAADLETDTADR